ncbi:response regulator [Flammeovirga aprica]|uniref:Response regulator n=1 Tax=Flammeovirga aprica JL-4 TaxID=694437 RepID=A0A7X9RTC9_9BACT|nr:response regulator [Flammeovirga aprica]NME68251.1 response regulator [Flammeovirga aprica JL-4]
MKQLIFIDDDQLVIDISKIIIDSLPETANIDKFYFKSGDAFFQSIDTIDLTKENVMFLDLNMPGLDGWQVVDEIKDRNLLEHFSIYVLSSSLHPKDKERADKHPCIEKYIEKPLSKAKLRECLGVNVSV